MPDHLDHRVVVLQNVSLAQRLDVPQADLAINSPSGDQRKPGEVGRRGQGGGGLTKVEGEKTYVGEKATLSMPSV